MTPLQTVLVVTTGLGVLITLIGAVMMLVAAFKESPLWGLMVLLFSPIATPCFLVLHWQAAKKAFTTQLLGTSFIMLGFAAGARLFSDGLAESIKAKVSQFEEAPAVEFSGEEFLSGFTIVETEPVSAPERRDGDYAGKTLEQVRTERGEPRAMLQFEGKTLLVYEDVEFISEDGVNVTDESRR